MYFSWLPNFFPDSTFFYLVFLLCCFEWNAFSLCFIIVSYELRSKNPGSPKLYFFPDCTYVLLFKLHNCWHGCLKFTRVHKRTCKKKELITRGDDMEQIHRGEIVENETVPFSNGMLIESRESIEMRIMTEGNSRLTAQLDEMGSKRKHKEIEESDSSKYVSFTSDSCRWGFICLFFLLV